MRSHWGFKTELHFEQKRTPKLENKILKKGCIPDDGAKVERRLSILKEICSKNLYIF